MYDEAKNPLQEFLNFIPEATGSPLKPFTYTCYSTQMKTAFQLLLQP